jgi:serine/threonine-protein kinase RsbW
MMRRINMVTNYLKAAVRKNGWTVQKTGWRVAAHTQKSNSESIIDPEAPQPCSAEPEPGEVRAIMDEVHFHQLSPGTEIEMIKHRVKKEL